MTQAKRQPGEIEGSKGEWWVVCPPYTTSEGRFDSIGPYATKDEAKKAWSSLIRSVRKWDKDFGKVPHDHLERVDEGSGKPGSPADVRRAEESDG